MRHPLFSKFLFILCLVLRVVQASRHEMEEIRRLNFCVFSTFHILAVDTGLRYESPAVVKRTHFASVAESYKPLGGKVQTFMDDITNNPMVRDAIDHNATFLPLPVTNKIVNFMAWMPGTIGAFRISMSIADFVGLLRASKRLSPLVFDISIALKYAKRMFLDQALHKRILSCMNLIASISRNADDFYRYFLPLKQYASILKIDIPQGYTRLVKPLDIIPAPSYPLALCQSPGGVYDAILVPLDAFPFIAWPIVLAGDMDCIAVLFIKSPEFFENIKSSEIPPLEIDMHLLAHFD